jgi:hypothetical protein
MPPTKIGYCVGCGAEGEVRSDRRKRPYWRCIFCGITIFMPTEVSVIGFNLMQSIIRKSPLRYREAIMRRMAKDRRRKIKDEKAASKP